MAFKRLESSTLLIHFVDENNYTFIHMTDDNSTAATFGGISQGSSSKAIQKKYAQADHKIITSDGSYLVYYEQNLLFSLDKNGDVANWGVFRKKEKK